MAHMTHRTDVPVYIGPVLPTCHYITGIPDITVTTYSYIPDMTHLSDTHAIPVPTHLDAHMTDLSYVAYQSAGWGNGLRATLTRSTGVPIHTPL